MNKVLLVVAALMVLSFGGKAVQAADMPVKAAPVPVFSWSGCYVGVQAGYKWGSTDHIYGGLAGGAPQPGAPAGFDATGWFHVNGAVGGGEAGCQYQWGSWVWGIEIDGSFSAAEGQSNPSAAAIALPGAIDPRTLFSTSERWLATARGRLGYAWDNWLWYVTAGAAWGGFDLHNGLPVSVNPAANFAAERKTAAGWVVGYGTEYNLGHGWSVKSESLYIQFDRMHYGDQPFPCAPPAFPGNGGCPNADVKMHEWIWRVGMNYKFDWYTPVVAKY